MPPSTPIFLAYQFALWTSVALSLSISVSVFSRPTVRGRLAFVGMTLSAMLWSGGSACIPLLSGFDHKLLAAIVGLFGSASIAQFWFAFAYRFAHADRRLHPAMIIFLAAVPATAILLAVTNSLHLLTWRSATLEESRVGTLILFQNGPAILVHSLISYAIFFGGAWLLIQSSMKLARPHMKQTVLLVVAAVLPLLSDLSWMSGLIHSEAIDLTPLTVSLSVLLVFLSIHRFGLFSVVPIAHDTLFRNMTDGVIVIDAGGLVVELNPAARKMLNAGVPMIGAAAATLLDRLPGIGALLEGQAPGLVEIEALLTNSPRIEVAISPLYDHGRQLIGRLITLRDISERWKVQQEREKLIGELQAALDNVKVLRGLIPICASCKKIRDDKGYWQQVESYMCAHAGVTFSHGICPDCMYRLYPDLFPEKNQG